MAVDTSGRRAGLNTPVRDGKFEFVVQKVECGESQLGDEMVSETAQGQFCLVRLTVKNVGDVSNTLFDSQQKAFSATGSQFTADSSAGLLANAEQLVWVNPINPGNSVNGIIVQDIPKDANITRIELHDSAFSGGVTINTG